MFRFAVSLFISGLFIFFAVYFGAYLGYFRLPSAFLEILICLFAVTLGIYYFLLKRVGDDSFTVFYLMSIVGKFLGYGILVVVFIMGDKAGAVANVVFFMATYVIFTILEISFLFRKVNA